MSLPISIIMVGAILLLVLGLKALIGQGMLAAVLRSALGLLLLAGSAVLFLAGYDLHSYRSLLDEQAVVTMQFQKLQSQRYRVILVESNGEQYRYHLSGDQWQLDARIVKWHPTLASLGFKSLYRLDRLSGRYADIRQQLEEPASAHQLVEPPTDFDTWMLLKKFPGLGRWIDAQYGSATFLPMADGAVYEVKLAFGGMLARPVNSEAKQAVSTWR